jgi:hypothetical protein
MTAPDIFTDWGLGDSGLCDQIQTGLAFKTGLNLILMSMKMFSTARLRNAAPKFKKGYKPELVTPDITIAMTTSDLNL